MCSPDLELLCLSLRPFYLPRDYGNIFICAVYIPPSGNASKAASRIADCVHQQLKNKPDAPLFTLGDVNHCRLEQALPGFQQYVRKSTRKDKILDKCYGNINHAYEARIRPPLSNSDHNTVLLIPTYKSAIKRCKPVSKTVSVWQETNKEELSGCFYATDWEVFHEDNINRTTEVITDYILFCVDSLVPKKTIKVFPNNKDYITPDIKNCIRRKKQAFRSNNRMELKTVQNELNRKLKAAREQHSTRVREAFANKSPKEMWNSVKEMTNMNSGKKELQVHNELDKANELNLFYKRFDSNPAKNVHDCREMVNTLVCEPRHRILIEPRDVSNVFNKLLIKKSSGPDHISAFLLKTFSQELTPAWTPLFQRSVDSGSIPAIWKEAVIIPVAKNSCPKENNDFRPVALTSIVMKSLERIMVRTLCAEVEHLLDPHQFAYNRGRGTDDALNSTTHLILKHLEDRSAYARLLFMDFSSAFNSILPQILLDSLRKMDVNPYVINWYCDFLIERQQKVKVNSTLSETQHISTGAPQGCVSSPVLFIIYTNDLRNQYPNNHIIKFSDDTVILSLLKTPDISLYEQEIVRTVEWCDRKNLFLNVKKTKEIVFDPRSVGDQRPILIKEERVEQVNSYKYLGVYFDPQLSWACHVDSVCSRVNQRLHFLRRLRIHGVSNNILLMFYRANIESIIRYGITTWFGNLAVKLKTQLQNLVKRAGKIIGMEPPCTLQEIFDSTVLKQGLKVTQDPSHILHNEFILLPSGRRYREPPWKLNRFKYSFVPLAVKALNKR